MVQPPGGGTLGLLGSGFAVATEFLILVLAGLPVHADDTSVTPDDDSLLADATHVSNPGHQAPTSQSTQGLEATSCADFVDGVCPYTACVPDDVSPLGGRLWMVAGGGFMDEIGWCRPAEEVEAPAVVTAGMVVRVLRRVPLPASDSYITHPYLSAGLVGARVDTTYTATFSVDGGVAQLVPGTVTVEGVPVGLEIQEAGANLNGRY